MEFHPSGESDLITIGLTCYNAADTVERAVRSAHAQAWPTKEIIVVDDASNDGSSALLEHLACEITALRVIRHPENRGAAAARNTLLAGAHGEFVAFFDDDDVSDPTRLAVQHERIVQYERTMGVRAVVCYTATHQRHPSGQLQYSPTIGMDRTPAPSGMDVARLILLGKPVEGGSGACPTSSLMARRQALISVGGFDESLRRHEDTDLNLRFAMQGAHFAGLGAPLVTQTITFAPDKTLRVERENLVQFTIKHRELLESWKWYDFNMRWIEMKFDLLQKGVWNVMPQIVRLFLMSPAKFIQKTLWSIPNRGTYSKYRHRGETGLNSRTG